jgi:hypothetical protein
MGFQNAGRAAPDSPGNGPLDAHSLAACCDLPNSPASPAAQAENRIPRADHRGNSGSARPPARILGFKPFERNTLRRFFEIELASGLILRGCTLHEKNGRRWVGLPAKPYATDTGAQSWAAIVDFRDKRTAARFQELATAAAVAAYERGGQ